MPNKKVKFSNFITKAITYVFLGLASLVLIAKTVALGEKFYTSAGTFASIAVIAFALIFLLGLVFFGSTIITFFKKLLSKLSVKKMFLIILCGAFIVRALFIIVFPIDSSIHPDIYVYVNTARQLAESGQVTENALYVTTYPHMFSVGLFLYLPTVIFGANVYVLNITLSLLYIIATVLLFDTVKYRYNKDVAFVTTVIFTLVPSQLFLSQFLIHENILIILTIASFWLVFRAIPSVNKLYQKLLLIIPLGLIIALCSRANTFAIIIYACLIVYAVVDLLRNCSRQKIIVYSTSLVVLICSYFAVSACFNLIMKKTLVLPENVYTEPALMQWSLYIGTNYETSGGWNATDAETYFHTEEGWSDSDIKNYRSDLLKTRIADLFSSPDKAIKLFVNKFKIAWGNWEYPIGYANECITFESTRGFYNKIVYKPLFLINELTFIGCAFVILISARPKELENSYVSTYKLYLIPVSLILLIVESSAKYPIFIPSIFMIIGVSCYRSFFDTSARFNIRAKKFFKKLKRSKDGSKDTVSDNTTVNKDNTNS